MKVKNKLIIMYGPTGVGKTDCSLALEELASIEIINGDVGQLYQPLSIGTAKPNWKMEKMPHHLFDYCQEPKDITVVEYRDLLLKIVQEVWKRGSIPVIVGGSGFYIKSLFFPPKESILVDSSEKTIDDISKTNQELWDLLYEHDPERAHTISSGDRYRVVRALSLLASGIKASDLVPEYVPFHADVYVLFLNRDRQELYDRINQRTSFMMEQGWIEEVKTIMDTPWESFLLRKKLIGYNDIIQYLYEPEKTLELYEKLISNIQKKTRNYAKRQITFWRMLQKLLNSHFTFPSQAHEVQIVQGLDSIKKSIECFLKDI